MKITAAGTASPSYTLKVMTVAAVIFMPFVLAYQSWSFWVFRKRLGSAPPSGTEVADRSAQPVVSSEGDGAGRSQ